MFYLYYNIIKYCSTHKKYSDNKKLYYFVEISTLLTKTFMVFKPNNQIKINLKKIYRALIWIIYFQYFESLIKSILSVKKKN